MGAAKRNQTPGIRPLRGSSRGVSLIEESAFVTLRHLPLAVRKQDDGFAAVGLVSSRVESVELMRLFALDDSVVACHTT